jgi:hypothetical protein
MFMHSISYSVLSQKTSKSGSISTPAARIIKLTVVIQPQPNIEH